MWCGATWFGDALVAAVRHDAAVHVLAVRMELRIPQARSLKDKRQVLASVLERARSRYPVSVAEVDGQDSHQRAVVGFAVVSGAPGLAEEVMDSVVGLVWSRPELEVVGEERSWLEW
jgi:uncharacterized protein YlxP (DUF503 family)